MVAQQGAGVGGIHPQAVMGEESCDRPALEPVPMFIVLLLPTGTIPAAPRALPVCGQRAWAGSGAL